MITERKAANAVGGKTARACDSCMCKRARWYCTADDAFLCQACDASVHSANSLARRHERVRLKTASLKATSGGGGGAVDGKAAEEKSLLAVPAWHQGFRRKARTPRHGKPMLQQQSSKSEQDASMLMSSLPLVPELGNDETSPDDENDEEQLLYRVPIFDPFVAEFCSSMIHNDVSNAISPTTDDNNNHVPSIVSQPKPQQHGGDNYGHVVDFDENFPLPSDMDLTEFAADVETLLGTGLDEDSFCMESLGLLDSKEEASTLEYCFGIHNEKAIKVEEDEGGETMDGGREHHHNHLEVDISRETLDLNFDYDSPTTGEEEDEKVVGAVPMMMMNNSNGYNCEAQETTKSVALKLNYDAVIAAWASQGGSPWTTGDRPHVKTDDCWPDCLGGCHIDHIHHQQQHHYEGDAAGVGGSAHVGGAILDDGGREARVSRYREKRRTRLFSKKIRYEVRKLNAEKRPRMKGRFVKRTSSSSSFMGTSAVVSAGMTFC